MSTKRRALSRETAAAAPVASATFEGSPLFEPFVNMASSVARTYGWTAGQCAVLAMELFYGLRAMSHEENRASVSLPAWVDMCWHALLLETELYACFCAEECGQFVHHTRATADDAIELKRERVSRLRAVMVRTSGREGNAWALGRGRK